MIYKDFFDRLSQQCGIRTQRLFWDRNILGVSPSEYLTWVPHQAEKLNSEDGREITKAEFQVSIFTKNGNLEKIVKKIQDFCQAEDADCSLLEADFYEKEFGYEHGEITIIKEVM